MPCPDTQGGHDTSQPKKRSKIGRLLGWLVFSRPPKWLQHLCLVLLLAVLAVNALKQLNGGSNAHSQHVAISEQPYEGLSQLEGAGPYLSAGSATGKHTYSEGKRDQELRPASPRASGPPEYHDQAEEFYKAAQLLQKARAAAAVTTPKALSNIDDLMLVVLEGKTVGQLLGVGASHWTQPNPMEPLYALEQKVDRATCHAVNARVWGQSTAFKSTGNKRPVIEGVGVPRKGVACVELKSNELVVVALDF